MINRFWIRIKSFFELLNIDCIKVQENKQENARFFEKNSKK